MLANTLNVCTLYSFARSHEIRTGESFSLSRAYTIHKTTPLFKLSMLSNCKVDHRSGCRFDFYLANFELVFFANDIYLGMMQMHIIHIEIIIIMYLEPKRWCHTVKKKCMTDRKCLRIFVGWTLNEFTHEESLYFVYIIKSQSNQMWWQSNEERAVNWHVASG